MREIVIQGAREGILKNITVHIPREKLVVFTGLSGSGKSTLLVDVLLVECQRQYLEAMGMQGIAKPQVDAVRNASPAILIAQNDANKNPRSTVGTLTDIYTDLRMIYEKLGVRNCPACGKQITSALCMEESEKKGEDFHVFMYCSECGFKMDKLTRTDFSFNTREGACSVCEGMGNIWSVNRETAVNEALALEEGAVGYWEYKYQEYQTQALYHAFSYYGIPVPVHLPVREYSPIQKSIFYEGTACDAVQHTFPHIQQPKTVAAGRFEGIVPGLMRRIAEKAGDSKKLNPYFEFTTCPECGGDRLKQTSRLAAVAGKRLPELSRLSVEDMVEWIEELKTNLNEQALVLTEAYLTDITTKLKRILHVGLGYLTLDRQVITLSGGELQRIRLAAALDCDLTGIIYILDEPTAGLHPRDTQGMVAVLKKLRDLGNTVLVIEHDEDVMQAADYMIDMGPGAGSSGGYVVAEGTLEELKQQEASVTGQYLKKAHPAKSSNRSGNGKYIHIRKASRYNLKEVNADFPLGCMTAVTGVSGSGKSTLVLSVLAEGLKGKCSAGTVISEQLFDKIITIEQMAVSRMKRSNVVTYSGVYTLIRKLFAGTEEARRAGILANSFSFNVKGGRCEHCEGMGYVMSNLLFFENVQMRCPICGGNRFQDKILSVRYHGYSINDILELKVEEAAAVFEEKKGIADILEILKDVGLSYLTLGQTLTTLSGGEGQRLKLARELSDGAGKQSLYLLDEPTTGLHPKDVEHFLVLLDRLTDAGSTVIVVEHNKQLIEHCDWEIILGPGGGNKGGNVMISGGKKHDAP